MKSVKNESKNIRQKIKKYREKFMSTESDTLQYQRIIVFDIILKISVNNLRSMGLTDDMSMSKKKYQTLRNVDFDSSSNHKIKLRKKEPIVEAKR